MTVRLLIFLAAWGAIALLFYLWLARPLYRMGRMTLGSAVFHSFFWPVGLMFVDQYIVPPLGQGRDADDAPSDLPPKADYNDVVFGGKAAEDAQDQPGPPPRKPNYNNMVFGGNETDDEAEERQFLDFIAAQTGTRDSAPLGRDLTISYAPSGISKTYRAGTIFPEAFIADWRAGFFKGV